VQQVVGIHSHTGPGGAPGVHTARFRTGFKGTTLLAVGEPEAPAGATVCATSEAAALRTLSFPFPDPKKAAQVAPFEVEGMVPYDIDASVVSHEPLAGTDGGARLLVAVAPHGHVAELVEAHGGADRPQVIVPEAFALFAFAQRLALDGPGAGAAPVLAVDVRAGRMLLVGMDGARWLGSRCVTAEWDPAADPLAPASAVAALRRAAQSLYLEAEVRPERIVVTGQGTGPGGAPGPEAVEALAKGLGLEAVPFEAAAEGLADLTGGRIEPGPLAVAAVAVGAGLAAVDGRRRMNLRAGPFALFKEDEGRIVRRVAGVGLGVLLVLIVAWADGQVRYGAAQGRLEAAKAGLEEQYRAVFPGATRVVDPVVQARNQLKSLTARSLLFGGGDATPLGVLDAVSRAIPEDLVIDVLEFSVEGGRVRMEAEAASFDAIDQINARLAQRPEFAEVRVSDAKASAKENRVKFRVSATLSEGI
jgi:general secretion pathway protein L